MSSAEGRLRLEYRLIVSRVAAWVIWLSAWLVLGRLGQTEAALTLGGLWPLAAWMLCMFGLLAQHRARRVSGLRLRLSLCLGLAAALIGQLLLGAKRHSLEGLSSDWIAIETIRDLLLILSAFGWAVSVVYASYTVRALREMRAASRPVKPAATPMNAALIAAGLLSASIWTFDATLSREILSLDAALFALCAAAVIILSFSSASNGLDNPCTGGLFDCAISFNEWGEFRKLEGWIFCAARMTMVPMMASLAWAAQWCAGASVSTASMLSMHILAMFVPAFLLQQFYRSLDVSFEQYFRCGIKLITAAMMASSFIMLLPDLQGVELTSLQMLSINSDQLMCASLLQSVAWSVAWFVKVMDPKFEPRVVTVPSFMIKTLSAAGLLNLLVLLLVGWGLSELGPRALAIAVLAPAFIASVAGLSVVWNLRPRLYQPSSLTNNHH